MTPEEKYKNDLLYVVNRIKQNSLYALKGESIEYWVRYDIFTTNEKEPTSKNEFRILEKLGELGAIKVLKKVASPNEIMIDAHIFYLEIIHPKFDELYAEFQAPLLKKEKYSSYSAESIKKLLCVLEYLKEEWDLTPKENLTKANIPQKRYLQCIHNCSLDDFYKLQDILKIFQQEGLILDAESISEYM